jgi:hypothetical protein
MSQLPIMNSDASPAMLTSHAMLIPWGVFAKQIGLVAALEQVPIDQRRRDHRPQTKLIEFLVSILSGCAYLQDISRGSHPLDQDRAVAQAWGQDSWADYSGVSRTLQACDEETVRAVREALVTISQPFIEREVMLALRDRGVLIYDGDLTGRPVSNNSTTYPDAAFGWMSDTVKLGYQAALVSMHSPSYGRLWLSVKQHPGDTVSSSQAEAMIRAAEASTGAYPWRRVDLLSERIQQQQAVLHDEETKCRRAAERVEQAQHRLDQAGGELEWWRQEVLKLDALHQAQNRPVRPHSRLAQALRKQTVREKRLVRRKQELEQANRWWEGRQQTVTALRSELEGLDRRLVQFQADNLTNPWPIEAIFRLDGGFGHGDNIALLIEMGYGVYSKAANVQVVRALRRRAAAGADWTRVGKNAEMVAWIEETITCCPYPLEVALERFHIGEKEKYGVLLHYGNELAATDLAKWFSFYNGRQTIEAGIKEGKGVFQMHHLKARSTASLAIQEEFAAFGANVVRWAAEWLHETNPEAPAPFNRPQPNVKQMVRIGANTSAWVMWQPGGCLLTFTDLSAFAGTRLVIQDSLAIQLALPLFESCVFSPI